MTLINTTNVGSKYTPKFLIENNWSRYSFFCFQTPLKMTHTKYAVTLPKHVL